MRWRSGWRLGTSEKGGKKGRRKCMELNGGTKVGTVKFDTEFASWTDWIFLPHPSPSAAEGVNKRSIEVPLTMTGSGLWRKKESKA
jgi:hypothetical protein